jgi:intein/homing endonuclease
VIPKEILKAKKNIVNACLRGIFDTDGGIIIDKRPSYKEPYIRIHLRMMSSKLVTQIHQILQEQGINARISDDTD